MFNCIFRRTLIAAAFFAAAIPAAHAFSFSDGTMFNLLYARTVYQYGPGGSATVGTTSTLGNPGNGRTVQLSHNGMGAGIGLTHIATQSAVTLQPGGIANINMSIDLRLLNNIASLVDFAFVVEQSGRRYATFLNPQQGTTSYQTLNALNLNENDFEEITFDGTFFTDSSQRPDFQLAGSTIRFGFWTSSEGFSGAIHEGIYDNFVVSGTAVPEPTAIAALGLGLAAVARRRKRN